jgi:hypothetical protein
VAAHFSARGKGAFQLVRSYVIIAEGGFRMDDLHPLGIA